MARKVFQRFPLLAGAMAYTSGNQHIIYTRISFSQECSATAKPWLKAPNTYGQFPMEHDSLMAVRVLVSSSYLCPPAGFVNRLHAWTPLRLSAPRGRGRGGRGKDPADRKQGGCSTNRMRLVPSYAVLCCAALCCAVPCHAMQCHAILYSALLCHILPGYAIPYHAVPYCTVPYGTAPKHAIQYPTKNHTRTIIMIITLA